MYCYRIGADPGPDIEVYPLILDFGTVTGSRETTAVVRNTGAGVLNITAVSAPTGITPGLTSFAESPTRSSSRSQPDLQVNSVSRSSHVLLSIAGSGIQRACLSIHDLSGRLIQRLTPDRHGKAVWNSPRASGVYFVRLEHANGFTVKPIVIVK